MIETSDKGVFIEDIGVEWVIYNDMNNHQRWKVMGVCNQCGLCDIGIVDRKIVWDKEPGEPYACRDLSFGKRRDVPMRPETKQTSREMAKSLGKNAECCLEFEWL